MGFTTPGDQRVPIPVRDWNGLKLALWRSKTAWEITARAAVEILEQCVHALGCPGIETETDPCLSHCRDRELRMSTLVILNAARMFAPIDARHPANGPYLAPSREYFSEVIAELGVAQLELEALRELLRAAGMPVPTPPPNPNPQLPVRTPSRLAQPRFEEDLDEREEELAASEDAQPESEAS